MYVVSLSEGRDSGECVRYKDMYEEIDSYLLKNALCPWLNFRVRRVGAVRDRRVNRPNPTGQTEAAPSHAQLFLMSSVFLSHIPRSNLTMLFHIGSLSRSVAIDIMKERILSNQYYIGLSNFVLSLFLYFSVCISLFLPSS